MHRLWSIFRKEFWEYFRSPIAYCVTLVFLELVNVLVFFMFDFLASESADLRDVFFGWLQWVYLLFIPAVAMRLWSEEKREGTLETVMTLPASLTEWTLGKFFAAWAFVGFGLFLTFPLVVSVAYLGNPDSGLLVCGYVSAFLLAGAYLAFGIFASSLSENQIIAFIIAAVGGFVFVVLGWPLFVKAIPEGLQPVASYMSFTTHQMNMSMGVIDSRDVIYFLSFIGFFLFLTIMIQEHRRYDMGLIGRSRRAFPGAPVVAILLVLTSLVGMNYFSSYRYLRWDWTEDKLHTLSPITYNTLQGLDQTVTIKAYLTQDVPPGFRMQRRRIEEMLREYEALSNGNLELAIIDPVENKREEEAQKRGVQVLQLPDPERKFVRSYLGVVIWCKDSYETIPALSTLGDLEYQITRAIKKVTVRRQPVVTVLCSDGRRAPQMGRLAAKKSIPEYSILEQELEGQYDVRVAAFAQKQERGMLWEKEQERDISPETETLIILEPNGLMETHLQQINAVVQKGGNVIVFFEAKAPFKPGPQYPVFYQPVRTNMEKMLASWGVGFQPKQVNDFGSNMRQNLQGVVEGKLQKIPMNYPPWVAVKDKMINKDSAITMYLKNKVWLVNPCLLELDEARVPKSVSAKVLLSTSDLAEVFDEQSARRDYNSELDYFMKHMPNKGQRYPLAIYLTGQFPGFSGGKTTGRLSKPARVLLVANATMLKDGLLTASMRNPDFKNDNLKFALNAVDIMTLGNDEIVQLRGKEEKPRKFDYYDDLRDEIRRDSPDLLAGELKNKQDEATHSVGVRIMIFAFLSNFLIVALIATGVFVVRWRKKRIR